MYSLIVNLKKFFNKILYFFQYIKTLILLFDVTPVSDKDLIIVTASDSSHFKSLKNLLLSIIIYERNIKIIVVDLGLTKKQLFELKKNFQLVKVRKFNYSKYPRYFNIKINAGEYAWKPVIISNIMEEFKCCVIWMDAGNIITSELKTIKKMLNFNGFYVSYSLLKISEITHPKTLKFLKSSRDILDKQNISAACVGVNYNFNKIKKIISKWKQCALIRECIAPKGSSRKNHRYDQSVLGIIAYQANIINTSLININHFGFKIHQDVEPSAINRLVNDKKYYKKFQDNEN